MNLSKREKYIAIIMVLIVSLLMLDRVVLTPLFDYQSTILAESDRLNQEMNLAQTTFRKSKLMGKQWSAMQSLGLTASASACESKTLHAIRNWSQTAELDLVAFKPELSNSQSTLSEIQIHVTANGSMKQVARFIYFVETSELPIRVTDLQLGSKQNATDDLSLQVRLSVLYRSDLPDNQLAGGGMK